MLLIYSVFLFFLFSVGDSEFSCYTGNSSNFSTKTGCKSCQTTAVFLEFNLAMTSRACLNSSCFSTNNIVTGSGAKVFCCDSNNCNIEQKFSINTVVPGAENGNQNIKCYDSNHTILSGCRYCSKTTTNLVVTQKFSKSCVSVCVPIKTGIININCCQTDLCNGGINLNFHKGFLVTISIGLMIGKVIF